MMVNLRRGLRQVAVEVLDKGHENKLNCCAIGLLHGNGEQLAQFLFNGRYERLFKQLEVLTNTHLQIFNRLTMNQQL